MKKSTRILAIILCLVMTCFGLSMIASAADGETNTVLEVDAETVNVGDTFTVTLSFEDMKGKTLTFGVRFDNTLVKCTEIVGPLGAEDPEYFFVERKQRPKEVEAAISNLSQANTNSQIGFAVISTSATDSDYYGNVLFTATFEAIAPGEATFTAYEDSDGSDGYKGNGSSFTVSIKDSAPACDHVGKAYTYQTINATTHKVICECGEIVKEAENHDYKTDKNGNCKYCSQKCGHDNELVNSTYIGIKPNDDGNTHSEWTLCDCGTEYRVGFTNECVVNNADGDCLTAENCACGREMTPAKASHIAGEDDNNCTTPVKCVNCDKNAIEAKEHGHTLGFRYAPNSANTHNVICIDCSTTTEESVKCNDSDDADELCDKCGNNLHVCAENLTYVPALKATCNSTGNLEHYKCSCGILYKDAAATYEADPAIVILPIDLNNHVWGEVTYSWAFVNKKWTCTATRTCTVHTDIVESVTSTSSRIEETIKGDCTKNEKGKEYYTATFEAEWANNEFGPEDRYVGSISSHIYDYKDNEDGTTHTKYCVNGCTYYKPAKQNHKFNKKHVCSQCGAIEPTGWVEKDGAWYYVNADYTKANGTARVPYPTVAINGIEYAPNAEDIAYNPSFMDAAEAWFVFDTDGKFQSTKTGIENGQYVENGMIAWHPGYVEVNGEFYYFVADKTFGGNMLANGIVYATRGLEGKYLFENGKIVDFTGVLEGLYFVNGKVAMGAGLVKLADGNIIYVRSAGQIATGSYWVTADKANGLVNGGRAYEFDANGYLVTEIAKTGIYDGKYYVEGKLTYAGLIEIDGDIYYINSKGEVVTGKYYVTKTNGMDLGTNKLYFGEDGKMLKIMNGIYKEEGKLYYYVGNRKACGAGLIKIGEDYYYVRSSGEVQTGYFYISKTNDIEGFKTGDKCKFDENGKLIFNAGQK